MSATEALREATARAHRELEGTGIARQLEDGSIERQTYLDYLRAIAVLVANLRTTIRRHGTDDLKGLLPTLDHWTDRIDADIHALAPDDASANQRAQAAALEFVQKVFLHSGHETDWLYGVLYVLYGSHKGNLSIADAVSRGLGLGDGVGTSYFRATRNQGLVWKEFRKQLDARLVSDQQCRLAESGAAEMFRCFEQVFRALEERSSRGVMASAVNPEAGDHPVPQDNRLAEVAGEVGRACHLAFGYLGRRYGNRGEAFARSDGVWMVTLVELPETLAHRRVDWLAGLLSARGIPSICLEYHLARLHDALFGAGALGERELARLLALSEHVGASRRAYVSDERWKAITAVPVPSIDPQGVAILASAVIDQVSGLASCADSITEWIERSPSLNLSDREELLAVIATCGTAVIRP